MGLILNRTCVLKSTGGLAQPDWSPCILNNKCLGMPGRDPDPGWKRLRERLPHREVLARRQAVRDRRRNIGGSALADWPHTEPGVQMMHSSIRETQQIVICDTMLIVIILMPSLEQ